jgi:hypothetical protein
MGGISIMVNSSTEGNISLEEQMQIGVGGFPLSIATADLNRDSTPEIVVANWEVEGMRVIHNFLPVSDNISGDINGDGILNILDIVLMVNMILSNEYSVVADVNEDGSINILDVVLMVNILIGGLPQSN